MASYRYHLPGCNYIIEGQGFEYARLGQTGFAIAPFIPAAPNDESAGIVTIDCKSEKRLPIPAEPNFPKRPSDTFTEEKPTDEYLAKIRKIVKYHKEHGGKTVFSRRIFIHKQIDSVNSFYNLCRAFPDAFVFLFETECYGTWIGASPELLLRKEGNLLSTMALAGTRPTGSLGEWDLKNIEEQRMVSDFICGKMEDFGLQPLADKTFTKPAGPVEHICTAIRAEALPPLNIVKLLKSLSPTPALCGSDREVSLKFIDSMEESPRELYGGWCGPVSDGNLNLFVNLRSAKILKDYNAILFSGGGITGRSIPEDEWSETERKAMTLKRNLSFFDK